MATPHSSNTGTCGTNSKGRNGMFGCDEFNALLGGQDGISEVLTRRSTPETTTTSSGTHNQQLKSKQKDISDMTVKETAALMISIEQGKKKGHQNGGQQPQRLRAATNKAREYHMLLEEQEEEEQLQPKHSTNSIDRTSIQSINNKNYNYNRQNNASGDSGEHKNNHLNDDALNDMTSQTQSTTRRRKKATPLVLVELGAAKDQTKLPSSEPSRSNISGSFDADDNTEDDRTKKIQLQQQQHQQLRRQNNNDYNNTSSEDEDSSVDRRRSRALQKRRYQQSTKIEADNSVELDNPNLDVMSQKPIHINDVNTSKQTIPTNTTAISSLLGRKMDHDKEPPAASNQNDRDSDGDTTSSSSSDQSDDDSESVSSNGIAKPIFVPKHRRTILQSIDDENLKQREWQQQEQERLVRRKRESRALLQQTLMNAKLDHTNTNREQMMDGITGATNDVPTDNDEEEEDERCRIGITRYDAWEVRELERILHDWDVDIEKMRNEQERNNRRRRYAPNSKNDYIDECSQQSTNKIEQLPSKAMVGPQRYHHRGAFFMDDTEDNEIRRKAMQFGSNVDSTVLLADDQHRDRTQLPKVMQVKKFGFANQSKYKGLAAEDTTDKSLDVLPIVNNRNQSRRLK